MKGGEPERPPTASKKDAKAPAKGKGIICIYVSMYFSG
jgi:hypothetical protein